MHVLPWMCSRARCPARRVQTPSSLVLDALHLNRQLMLAAPILALGLPTMVLLNMADLMEARGGKMDRWLWPRSWAVRLP